MNRGNISAITTSLYLPEELRKAFRIRAIEKGTSITKLVEKLIREYLCGPGENKK